MYQSLYQVPIILEKYKFNFSNLPEQLKCVLCHEILKNAKQTSCGCKVCEKCIISYLSNGVRPCPSNQSDCMNVKLDINRDIHQDNATNKEIGKVVVNCTFHKCSYSGALIDMVEHIESCEFQEIISEQCANEFLLEEKVNHDKNKCDLRMVTCDYCSLPFSYKDLINIHWNADRDELCPRLVRICPNNCNETHKVNLKEHLKICANKKVECPFHQFDCKIDKMSKSNLIKHMEDEYFDHTSSLINTINTLELGIASLRSEFNNCQTSSTTKIKNVENEISKVKLENVSLKSELNKYQTSSTTKIRNLENEISKLNSKFDNQVKLENVSLKSELDRQVIFTKELFEMNKNSSDSRLKIEEAIKELKRKSPSSDDASFIWKFTDFKVSRVDAERGGRVSVTSVPFYTSKFGYKMCLRVYPAGNGVGKGTYLSVFFAIMRGEFDDLLPWPFKQKVTLSILDRESGNRHHSGLFIPDARSECFQKPTGECNIASGSPKFILLAQITNNTIYCTSDTIFLKIAVDTMGISRP